MTVAFLALAIERFLGFSSPLRKLIGHPTRWLDRFTGIFAMLLPGNQAAKLQATLRGAMFCIVSVGASLALSTALTGWLRPLPYAWCWEAALAVPFLQQYATRMRARAVAAALSRGNMDEAAHAVAAINPEAPAPQTPAQAVRRTIEGMAWNLCAGIVTPAFWLAVFGLPGIVTIAALGAVERHAVTANPTSAAPVRLLLSAARFLPCKLAGLLVAGAASMVSPSAGARALEHIQADARFDRTRDANWPRAAFAGVLSIRLGGPEAPGQTQRTDHWIGNGARDADEADLRAGLRLFATTLTLFTVLAGLAAAFA
jgi:adenosylcobinamide-phosphate synthase